MDRIMGALQRLFVMRLWNAKDFAWFQKYWIRGRLLHSCLAAILLCSACVPVVTVTDPVSMQALKATEANYPPSEYKIMSGDRLEIKFFKHPELNELVQVRPDGRISLQLAPDIMVAGKTPEHLTAILTERYKSELRNPQITVFLRSCSQQKVFVGGAVHQPLLIPLEGTLSALQSISLASGFQDNAVIEKVVLIRRTDDKTIRVFRLNLAKVIDGSDPTQDVNLHPLDILFVPEVDGYGDLDRPIPLRERVESPGTSD